jgi:hypothetical protein
MSSKTDKLNGDRELLQTSELPMTADAILSDFTHYFGRLLGRRTIQIDSPFLYQSVSTSPLCTPHATASWNAGTRRAKRRRYMTTAASRTCRSNS